MLQEIPMVAMCISAKPICALKPLVLHYIKKEYQKLLSKNWRKPDTFSTLSNAFRVFDRQDKGFIQEEDIKKILISLGEPFTTEEVNEFIRKSKPDTQSQIDYDKISLMVFNK